MPAKAIAVAQVVLTTVAATAPQSAAVNVQRCSRIMLPQSK
jgi:hypothetical protein